MALDARGAPATMHRMDSRSAALAVAVMLLAGAACAQDPTHYQGTWRGPFLFYVTSPEADAQGAAAVHEGTLQIAADGTVRASIPEAACTLSGTGVDYVSDANASLEVDLVGCADARFSGRFRGRLISNPTFGYASLRLMGPSAGAATARISAIIRR